MKTERRKLLQPSKLLDSEDRKRILDVLKEDNLSISQLENRLKMNRGTLRHHLSMLIRNHLLIKEQQKHLPGKPVIFRRVENYEKRNKDLIKILKILKGGSLTTTEMKEKELDKKYGLALSYALFEGLIDSRSFIVEKGEDFLKDNEN